MPILIVASFLILANRPLFAAGELIKLKAIADGMASQEEVLKKEAANYQKAESFINSPDIKKGFSQDAVLKRCGEPVARVCDDGEWVYKPPSSTFFKGEKIYFVFDSDKRLIDWKKTCQK